MGKAIKAIDLDLTTSKPDDWDIIKLRQAFAFGKGLNITKDDLTEEGIPVISYGQIHSKSNTGTGLNKTLIRHVPEIYMRRNKNSLTQRNDFLFADTSEDYAGIGNCVFVDSDERIFAGYHTIIARPVKSDIIPKYLAYMFQTDFWRSQIRARVMGVKVFSITQALLRNTFVLMPPIEEQRQIIAVLDAECAKIDSIICDLQNQIEQLKKYKSSIVAEIVTTGIRERKFKKSSIEWARRIPEEWTIKRMQDIAEYKKGPFGSSVTVDMFVEKGEHTYKVYEQKNAINADFSLGWYYLTEQDYKALKDFSVCGGDIIVSCAGTIGKCYILPENAEPGIINQALMRVRIKEGFDKRYFLYLFDVALEYMNEKYSNGSAMKNIPPFSVLKKQSIPVPPTKEQSEIVSYLDRLCESIQSVFESKEQQLMLMQERKRSLIYEYVTGKKRIKETATYGY